MSCKTLKSRQTVTTIIYWPSDPAQGVGIGCLAEWVGLFEEVPWGVSERESPLESHSVERQWAVAVRYLLSSKRTPHFKTHNGLRHNKNTVTWPQRLSVLARTNSKLPDQTPLSSTLKMKAACTCTPSETIPTATQYKSLRAESKSTVNHQKA
jgi:hypothetical protein